MSSSVEHQREKELIDAAIIGDTDSVQKLLDQGVDVNWNGVSGSTPLIGAVIYNHSYIVKLLLDKNADVNTQSNHGWTALMYAALNGSKDVVDMLLEKGAIVDIKDKDYETAIDFAREKGCKDIADKLEKAQITQHNERRLWKKREGALQLQIQNLVGQIDQLKQEQKEESKKAENTIASLIKTRLEAMEMSKVRVSLSEELRVSREAKGTKDDEKIQAEREIDDGDAGESMTIMSIVGNQGPASKMMHDSLLIDADARRPQMRMHIQQQQQQDGKIADADILIAALKVAEAEIISLREENQSLKNAVFHQELLTAQIQNVIQKQAFLSTDMLVQKQDLLAAEIHSAFQKQELFTAAAIQKGYGKQELLAAKIYNVLQKHELLANKMVQKQEMFAADIHNVIQKQELLVTEIQNAFEKQELHVSTEIHKGYVKQQLLAVEIQKAIQKQSLLSVEMGQMQELLGADAVQKQEMMADEIRNAFQKQELLATDVSRKQEMFVAEIHQATQKQELLIADMFNSCEKQDLRLLAPEIHKFIQKQEMRSTEVLSAEIQKQDYLRIAAEIRSLREEIAAALNVRNVGHHMIIPDGLSQDNDQLLYTQLQMDEKANLLSNLENITDSDDEWKVVSVNNVE